MASKKAKTKAAPAASSKQHPGPVKSLEAFPKEILKNIIDCLNYPTLEMLRATCKTLREDVINEKEIHEVFLDLRIDKYDMPDTGDDEFDLNGRCDACVKYCGEETPGVEYAAALKLLCKGCKSREYVVGMLRPGVLANLIEISVYDYHCCGTSDEAYGGSMGICQKCYSLTGKQRSGKSKRKAFFKKYGGWLRLQWHASAGRDLAEMDGSELEGDF